MVEPSQARKRRQSLTGIPDRFRPPVRLILTPSQMRRDGEEKGWNSPKSQSCDASRLSELLSPARRCSSSMSVAGPNG